MDGDVMQSGDLKHRIQCEAQTRASNSMGGSTVTWTTIFTGHCALWPLKGMETFEGGRSVAVATHRLRIRYRKPFKATWRFKELFTDKYYSIVTEPIDMGDRHQWLEMMVKETRP